MQRLRRFSMISMFLPIAFASIALAEVKVVNEQTGDALAHQLTCQSKEDFRLSPLPGFMEIAISTKSSHQFRHLPVAEISEIDYYDYGVYIEWKTERMKNGRGYLTTTVFVPKEVRKPEETMTLLKDAMTTGSWASKR